MGRKLNRFLSNWNYEVQRLQKDMLDWANRTQGIDVDEDGVTWWEKYRFDIGITTFFALALLFLLLIGRIYMGMLLGLLLAYKLMGYIIKIVGYLIRIIKKK